MTTFTKTETAWHLNVWTHEVTKAARNFKRLNTRRRNGLARPVGQRGTVLSHFAVNTAANELYFAAHKAWRLALDLTGRE